MNDTDLTWPTLLEKLAQPFPASAIYWRAGSVSRDKQRAQALPYAEPRVYEDRLNQVCPDLWSVSFRPWGESRIICDLTIGELTRSSTGEENEGFAPGTAAEAQAFKRACVKFGLGRYLYDVPIQWVGYDEKSRRLTETPTLPKHFLPRAQVNNEVETKRAALPTLSQERANAMHRELEKLGFVRREQVQLAASILEREVSQFTALTESEALEVWNVAKRLQAERSGARRAA